MKPASVWALALLLVPQLLGAWLGPVADCDETFNFWEPLHLLLFGSGLRTWEYSPVYALRSFLYLLWPGPYLPMRVLLLLGLDDKPMLFRLGRASLGLCSALADLALFRALQVHTLSVNCPWINAMYTLQARGHKLASLAFLAFKSAGAGALVAGPVFLPSASAGWLATLAHAQLLRHKNHFSGVLLVALAALLGWPFAALLGLPFVMLALSGLASLRRFVWRAALAGLLVCAPMLLVDSYFYGAAVLAPLNIVRYNVLSGGSELYGTEPWHFYVLNLLLNWNLVVPLALLGLLLGGRIMPASLRLTLVTWLAVFGAQPHKEERFLFPAYSLLCLSAAAGLQTALHRLGPRLKQLVALALLATFTLLSCSRAAALLLNYGAPLHVYDHFYHTTGRFSVLFCF